jgi:anti-sigma regulatory factor (Ser/Thr protein kinase)
VTAESHVRLIVPADASYLSVCRAALSGMLVGAGDDEVEEAKLVLSEVCAAAVAHRAGGELAVEFRTTPEAIEIAVTGPGTDSFLDDPIAREVMERLTTRWHVEPDANGAGACVRFARRLR